MSIHSRLSSLVYYSHPLHTHSSAAGSSASSMSFCTANFSSSRHFSCAWNHFSHAPHCSHIFLSAYLPFDKTENRVSGLVQKPPKNPGFSAFRLSLHKKKPKTVPYGEAHLSGNKYFLLEPPRRFRGFEIYFKMYPLKKLGTPSDSHCKDQFAEFAKSFVFHPLCSKTIYEHISTILAVVVWVYHPFWPKTTPYSVHLPF